MEQDAKDSPYSPADHGIRLIQPEKGYRFSVDALLLAEFARIRQGERVLDLGTGCGVIALLIARRHPTAVVTAIELQPELAALARENVHRNGLEDRVEIIEGDLNKSRSFLKAGHYGAVVSNPPYRSPASGRLCVEPTEARARHEILTDLDRVLETGRHALRPGGRIFLVYSADRSVRLLSGMRRLRLEPKRLRFVHARPNCRASLVLVEGVKDAGEELHVLPPLILHPQCDTRD